MCGILVPQKHPNDQILAYIACQEWAKWPEASVCSGCLESGVKGELTESRRRERVWWRYDAVFLGFWTEPCSDKLHLVVGLRWRRAGHSESLFCWHIFVSSLRSILGVTSTRSGPGVLISRKIRERIEPLTQETQYGGASGATSEEEPHVDYFLSLCWILTSQAAIIHWRPCQERIWDTCLPAARQESLIILQPYNGIKLTGIDNDMHLLPLSGCGTCSYVWTRTETRATGEEKGRRSHDIILMQVDLSVPNWRYALPNYFETIP